MMYVIEGPARVGNVFGYADRVVVPAGKYAVVTDGEYTDGGNGPSVVVNRLFSTREAADAEIQRGEPRRGNTGEVLRRWDACPEQIAAFERLFGAGGEVTLDRCLTAANEGMDFTWAAKRFFPPHVYLAYMEALAPAAQAYQEARATAAQAYRDATAAADKAYMEALARAAQAYREALARADMAYRKACAPAFYACSLMVTAARAVCM